jgi:hypothetical protein
MSAHQMIARAEKTRSGCTRRSSKRAAQTHHREKTANAIASSGRGEPRVAARIAGTATASHSSRFKAMRTMSP